MLKWGRGLAGFFICIIVIFLLIFQINNHKFNNAFFSDNVNKNAEEISSLKTDDEKVQYMEQFFKELNIASAGEDNTYLQNFKTMLPVYNSTPELSIRDKANNIVKSFNYEQDFKESLNGFGGTGNESGKIYVLNDNIKQVSKEILQNHIILSDKELGQEDLAYAVENKCKAIILLNKNAGLIENFDMSTKRVESLIIYKVSPNVFQEIQSIAKEDLRLYLSVDVSFKMKDTPNFLAKIPGKSKSSGYVIISSHIDEDNSALGLLMEYARVLKMQKSVPDKTIIFAVWSNYKEGMRGSKYYTDNPVYPLKESEVFVLDNMSSFNSEVLNMASFGEVGTVFTNKLSAYAKKLGIRSNIEVEIKKNDVEAFLFKDIPAVLLTGDRASNYYLNDQPIDENPSSDVGQVLLNYIQREVYNDWFQGLLFKNEILYISIVVLITLSIYLLKRIYKYNLAGKNMREKLEGIYYSSVFSIVDKSMQILIILGVVSFFIAFIVYIPNDFNVVKYDGDYISNYAIYSIAQDAILYIRDFFVNGMGKTETGFEIGFIISFSIIKSISLILSSVILAFLVGIIIGTLSAFKGKKKNNIGFIGPIAVLSLPDVLIAICVQLLVIFLREKNILHINSNELSKFLLPFISLAIIPTAYIARVAQIAVKEEITKDYIIAAKSKGLSNFYILKDHLLISVVIKVIETLPSVLNIIVSNVIIVEYLFSYPGIVYQLFSYFRDGDIKTCIGLIMGIGVVYFILSFIFKILAIIINPFKRLNIIGGKQNEKA